jgi:hypothetical protein
MRWSQTLGNAIKRDRLAHAFLLTGVRGVGKTSTARLIAKALNCIGPGRAGRADDRSVRRLRAVPRDRRGAAYRCDRDGRRKPYRCRRYPRDHRGVALFGGLGALQDLHHRRSPYAVQGRVQRPAEDARGAAGACEVPVRHDRGEQGPGDRAVALPALRSAAHLRRRSWPRISRAFRRRRASRPSPRRWR